MEDIQLEAAPPPPPPASTVPASDSLLFSSNPQTSNLETGTEKRDNTTNFKKILKNKFPDKEEV